jgi:hypothetical protein
MHYCIHVFTVGCPSEKQLNNIMAPYNENEYYSDETDTVEPPIFMWDWWQMGGRYGGNLKLKVDPEDENSRYEWRFVPREKRNGRVFWSSLLNKIKDVHDSSAWTECELFAHLGFNDGYIRVDGAYVCDILNRDDLGCWGFIDDCGTAFVREYWNGEHFEENEDFDDQYTAMLKKAAADPAMFLTVIDIHD